MGGRDRGADGACRTVANFLDGINTALRATTNLARAVELDVRRQIVWKINGRAVGQMMFL